MSRAGVVTAPVKRNVLGCERTERRLDRIEIAGDIFAISGQASIDQVTNNFGA